MGTVVVNSRADANGVLHLVLPLGSVAAGQELQVTIAPVKPAMTQEEWRAWVQRTAGSITDPSFQRHDQGEYEIREPLS